MSNKTITYETDIVVVGSGPGGATMARELSKAGKKVVLCEAGEDYSNFGKFYSAGKMLEKGGMTFSKEGLLLNIGKTVGGQSMVFAGTATKPPVWLKDKYGIDLEEEIEELYQEVKIQPLPDSLVGPGARLLMDSARDLGLDWQVMDKFIRPEKCEPNCGGCALGCTTGAKWTAREYVEEAKQDGAKLLCNTTVEKVITEGGKAVGVTAKGPGGDIVIKAEKVVVSAGGSKSPVILQKSGLTEVGHGLMVDPVLFVWGLAPKQGNMRDVPLTAGSHLVDDGIMLADMSFPRMLTVATLGYSGIKGMAYIRKAMQHNEKLLGVMVKVKDEFHGQVYTDGSISKHLDEKALQRLEQGKKIAKEILMKAGVKSKHVFVSKELGGHPGGTVALGKHLDDYCQTEITNCYCVDNSIIPEPWGQPPTVTIVSMAKRLAKHLLAN